MSSAGAQLADITEEELVKFIKIIGMIGSAHDGEVLNAARAAMKWLADHQTDLATLLTPPTENAVVAVGVGPQRPQPAPAPPPPPPAPAPPTGLQGSWQAVCSVLLAHYPQVLRNVGGPRNDEKDFVEGLLRKGWARLTDPQAKWLRDIAGRAGLSW